jgi:hypothetical protein
VAEVVDHFADQVASINRAVDEAHSALIFIAHKQAPDLTASQTHIEIPVN